MRRRQSRRKCLYITLSETERELRDGAASHGFGRWTTASRLVRPVPAESFSISWNNNRACFIPRTSSSAKPPSRSSRPSTARSRTAWCWTASPKFACWRKTRCATGGMYRDQALLRQVQHHRDAAGRPDRRCRRQDRAQRRPRRAAAGGTGAASRRQERRRARVIKYRGVKFRGGHHDVTITTGGLERVSAAGGLGIPHQFSTPHRVERHRRAGPVCWAAASTTGSSTLISAPRHRKSLAAIVFVVAAVRRGEKAALFVFDEELGLLFSRMKGLGIDLEAMQRSGELFIEQAGRRGAVARRIRPSGSQAGRRGRHQDRGDRRASTATGGDAGREFADSAYARTAANLNRRGSDLHDGGASTAWSAT